MKLESNIIACLKNPLMQTPSLMWYRMVYLQIYLQFIRPKLFKKVDKNQSINRSINNLYARIEDSNIAI